jgi:putative acetyltransferase
MEIIVDDLTGPEIAEFLEEHIEEMKAVTPSPESKHAVDSTACASPKSPSGR